MHTNRGIRSKSRVRKLCMNFPMALMLCASTGSGIFGWIATHVQRKTVVMQPKMILHSVLQLLMSLQEVDGVSGLLGKAGTGRASMMGKMEQQGETVKEVVLD